MYEAIPNIDINQLKTHIGLVRNMVATKRDITSSINNEINSISKNFKIPKKIVRKFFTQNESILKNKEEEEVWISILKELL